MHVACRNAPPPPIGVILHEEVYQLFIKTRRHTNRDVLIDDSVYRTRVVSAGSAIANIGILSVTFTLTLTQNNCLTIAPLKVNASPVYEYIAGTQGRCLKQ